MRITVVIPAFNEEANIGRTLESLLRPNEGDGPDRDHAGVADLDIVVAANGCVDRTADIARSFGVRVIDIATPSKTAALNAADAASTDFPRVYMDADMVVSPALIRALAEAVSRPGVLAAVPRAQIDATDSTWPVRAYYAINTRLPVFAGRLFGRGMIALAEQARARFESFPEIIADDMFLDAVVAADEKDEIDRPVRVRVPRDAGELVRRVARSREGNEEFHAWMREVGSAQGLAFDPVVGSRPGSWLRDVALPAPRLWPAAACYLAIVASAHRLRRSSRWTPRSGWGRGPSF
jgi:glycosyltransferase involved in cell wall biosynthesis